MTFSNDKTFDLWNSFMPNRHKIRNRKSNDLLSLQIYDQGYDVKIFDPESEFEKWAAAEVTAFDAIPDGMEPFILVGGLYAVFKHKGPASTGSDTFKYIFYTWLPDSDYIIDNRPHFEILGEKYKYESAESEEEVWIPIKHKYNHVFLNTP